jgi:hypothetical protein
MAMKMKSITLRKPFERMISARVGFGCGVWVVVKASEVLPMGRKGEFCRKSGRSERRRWRAMVEGGSEFDR